MSAMDDGHGGVLLHLGGCPFWRALLEGVSFLVLFLLAEVKFIEELAGSDGLVLEGIRDIHHILAPE